MLGRSDFSRTWIEFRFMFFNPYSVSSDFFSLVLTSFFQMLPSSFSLKVNSASLGALTLVLDSQLMTLC